MKKLKKLRREYLEKEIELKKLLIQETKITIKEKKLLYKLNLLDYWRTIATAKTINFKDIEDMKKLEDKFKKPRDKIHI